METTVNADEVALAKAHIRLVRKWRGDTRGSVGSGPAATDVRQTNQPIEVCDLRRIVNVCQRVGGIQRVVMDGDSERIEWYYTARNWLESGASALATVVIFRVGVDRVWKQKTGSESCPHRTTN